MLPPFPTVNNLRSFHCNEKSHQQNLTLFMVNSLLKN